MRLAWVVGISFCLSTGAMARGRFVPTRTPWKGIATSGELRCTDAPHSSEHPDNHACSFVFVEASNGTEWDVKNPEMFRAKHQSNPEPLRGYATGVRSPRYWFFNGDLVIREFDTGEGKLN